MRARVLAVLAAEENRKWWTLFAVSFGLFMIMLDNTVVNVALPTMQRDLHVSISQLEWVVIAYALTFASLLITGGKLADLYGRRRIFVVGLVIFSLSSLACGLASSAGFLIGARAVQGVGAALMNPATLSIIVATFAPKQRGQAIGIWAGVSALALAIGPLAGGLLTQHLNWNWFFFVSLYVQNILHYSATQAGAIFLPMVLLISVIAPVAGKLSDRVGSRWLMGGGMTLLGVSLLLYERVGVHSNFWTLLPQLLVGGVGMAMTMSPMTSAAMGAVPVEKAGVGSGVLNSFRQVGGSLGIAVMGAILLSYEHPAASAQVASQQFVDGLHAALLVSAVIAFAAAAVAIVLVRTKPAVERAHIAEAELAA